MFIIRSPKFILRPFKEGDEYSLIKNINNKKIAKNTFSIPYPYKRKDARFWINHNLQLYRKKKRTEVNFAIDIDGKVIGSIGLEKIDGHKAEIGYWLGEKYWGQGIMNSAVKLIMEYAFRKLRLRRVYANVFPSNKASARVLKKAGYKYEGRLRKYVIKDNKPLDILLFARVK